MRWSEYSLPWYFTPELSTTREKHTSDICVSKILWWIFFVFIHILIIALLENLMLWVLLVEIHAFLFLFRCITTHTLMHLNRNQIIWWNTLGNCLVSAGYIHIAPVVCSNKRFWYLASWIFLPGLRLSCWVEFLLWVNWTWGFCSRQGIWLCPLQLWILLCFSRIFLLSRHKLPCRRRTL